MIIGGASRRLGTTVPVAVAAAWTVALVAQTTGNAALLHAHDHGADAGLPLWVVVLTPPFWVTAAVFLVAWQVMVAAMMLPSSLPMMRLFSHAAARQVQPGRILLAFLGGYAAMWGAVGAAAFAVDVALHRAGDSVPSRSSRRAPSSSPTSRIDVSTSAATRGRSSCATTGAARGARSTSAASMGSSASAAAGR